MVVESVFCDASQPPRTLGAPEHVGSWEWDVASNRIYADDVAARLFGIDPDLAARGVPIERFEAGIHPEDRQWVSAYLRRTAEASGVLVAEYRTCPGNGEVRWVLTRGRFDHDLDGDPVRSCGIVLDITDRKDDGRPAIVGPAHQTDHVLERGADQCMALREILTNAGQPDLLKLADRLLMEFGRELAKQPRRRVGSV